MAVRVDGVSGRDGRQDVNVLVGSGVSGRQPIRVQPSDERFRGIGSMMPGWVSMCRPVGGNVTRLDMQGRSYAQSTAGSCVARAFDARAVGE